MEKEGLLKFPVGNTIIHNLVLYPIVCISNTIGPNYNSMNLPNDRIQMSSMYSNAPNIDASIIPGEQNNAFSRGDQIQAFDYLSGSAFFCFFIIRNI